MRKFNLQNSQEGSHKHEPEAEAEPNERIDTKNNYLEQKFEQQIKVNPWLELPLNSVQETDIPNLIY